jgi:hypothetical protein
MGRWTRLRRPRPAWTVEKLRVLPPFEFENWAVIALGGIPNQVEVGEHIAKKLV